MMFFARHVSKFCLRALLATVIGLPVVAQQHLVVPAVAATQDGDSRASVAGIMESGREQILIGSSHLQSLVGKSINALEFRRTKGAEAFSGGVSNLVVSMSIAPHLPLQAAATFADNCGPSPLVVFSGPVTAPNSPANPASTVLWNVDNVVRVPFQVPYLYQGGTLCIDIVGSAQAGASSPWWVADAALQSRDSLVIDLGPGTGPHCDGIGRWSSVDASELSAGGEARLTAIGANPAVVLGMIGRPSLAPIPLNPIGLGAPGAMAYLEEVYLSRLFFMTAPPIPLLNVGVANWGIPLPNESWMLGLEFASQWLDLVTWDVSNGVLIRISSVPPSFDMAHVEGLANDPVGDRSVNSAPVLRFEYTTP